MRRVLSAVVMVQSLACSVLSGLDDFGVGGESAGGGGLIEGGAAGSAAATGGGGASVGGAGGEELCVEGELLTDPFTTQQAVMVLNSAQDEDDPTFTADGLVLVFNSTRTGAGDLYASQRGDINDAWEPPTLVAELSTGVSESNPVLAPDGLTIWFHRNPAGALMMSTRASRDANWSDPGAVTLSDPSAGAGAVTVDLTTMILHSSTGFTDSKLFESRRGSASTSWGPLAYIQDLDLGGNSQEAWMSQCGRHVYWSSSGIWRASRADLDSDFSTPEELTAIGAIGAVSDPWLSADQRYMMFAVGPNNMRDIWEARR